MDKSYQDWLADKHTEQEAQCCHCGACCGASEDPCVHLVINVDGTSSCSVYASRLGPRLTVGGVLFNCVSIRNKAAASWPGDERCGYKRRVL